MQRAAEKGDEFVHESIIGSKFIGRIEERDTECFRHRKAGYRDQVLKDGAKIYGYNSISIDPEDDPYAYGFQVL